MQSSGLIYVAGQTMEILGRMKLERSSAGPSQGWGVLFLNLGACYSTCLVCENIQDDTFIICSLLLMLNFDKSFHKMARPFFLEISI